MKTKLILTVLIICNSLFCLSQEKNEMTISSKVELLVLDIDDVNLKVKEFISSKNLVPETFFKSKSRINLSFLLDYEAFTELEKQVPSWGYIKTNSTSSTNYQEEILEFEREIELLLKEKEQYQSLIINIDSTANDRFFKYWEKIITIEKEISVKLLAKEKILKKHKTYRYELNIIEEANSTEDYSTSWINMPGIEYSLLMTEQPEQGNSPDLMNGISLKYMFNTGKSYGILGLYKSMDSDTLSEIDETYIFAFGQDFYSKRMGRGQRKFFNLYTSLNTGVYISTSETQQITSWFVNPYLGFEIFKNKYFLLDNKVGYFLPYKNNRTQRGLLYNVSFNFVF